MKEVTGTERTKQLLIQAAGTLAAEQGLSHVSTRAIAKESGENIGSIHYHFGGKKGLFKAMIHEAMQCCIVSRELDFDARLQSGEAIPREELSEMVRRVISEAIYRLFRSGKPDWHTHVIYQLIQRQDELFEVLNKEYFDPEMAFMRRLIRCIKPELNDQEVFLHCCLIQLPIFAQASYQKALLRQLGADAYSDEYLKTLEDLLTRQALLLLELPLGRS
ncbi:CerR family C-terminal domain-containing protein [Kiritimatiellaeota bacterium B1221]|nr:CerR family C-terminal domain-containing protein [Kiritimatiellaeota bacterium B1221]